MDANWKHASNGTPQLSHIKTESFLTVYMSSKQMYCIADMHNTASLYDWQVVLFHRLRREYNRKLFLFIPKGSSVPFFNPLPHCCFHTVICLQSVLFQIVFCQLAAQQNMVTWKQQ
jgi:hypothetical protein